MQVEWIKRMLIKWGEAVFVASRGGCGASSSYPAYQMVHIRGTSAGGPPVDSEVLQMESVMAQIKTTQPKLYHIACDIYVQGLSVETTAGRQRCHRDTVYARLETLHLAISNRIADRQKNTRSVA